MVQWGQQRLGSAGMRVPRLAQWIKDLALLQLWLRLGSDPWPRNSIWEHHMPWGGWKRKQTKEQKKKKKTKKKAREFCCGSAEMNLSGNHENVGVIPGSAQWVKDLVLP